MKIMVIGGKYGRGWSGWFAIVIANVFVRGYDSQYTNILSMSDKDSNKESMEDQKPINQGRVFENYVVIFTFDNTRIVEVSY